MTQCQLEFHHHYAKAKYRSIIYICTKLCHNLIRQQISSFSFLPSIRSQLFHSTTFRDIMIRANGACYIPKIGVYNHRTITEGSRGMVISPISVGGVAENRIMHDNELSLSTCVWNDSTKFAQNVSEDNSRVYVCVYIYVHVDIVWIWDYRAWSWFKNIFPAITFW